MYAFSSPEDAILLVSTRDRRIAGSGDENAIYAVYGITEHACILQVRYFLWAFIGRPVTYLWIRPGYVTFSYLESSSLLRRPDRWSKGTKTLGTRMITGLLKTGSCKFILPPWIIRMRIMVNHKNAFPNRNSVWNRNLCLSPLIFHDEACSKLPKNWGNASMFTIAKR